MVSLEVGPVTERVEGRFGPVSVGVAIGQSAWVFPSAVDTPAPSCPASAAAAQRDVGMRTDFCLE